MKKNYIILMGNASHVPRVTQLILREYPQLSPVQATYATEPKLDIPGLAYCPLILDDEITSIEQLISNTNGTVRAILNRGEEFIELTSKLVSHFELPGPQYEAVKHFRDKAAFHKLMIQTGLEAHRPRTTTASLDALPEVLEHCAFPVVIKPFQGAKSRGVFILNTPADFTDEVHMILHNHFKDEPSLRGNNRQDVVIEEFIQGLQVTATSYIDHVGELHTLSFADVLDGRDIGATHQQLVFRTIPSVTNRTVQDTIIHILRTITQAAGLTSTFIHPDFLVDGEMVKMLELNVRMGGLRYEMTKYAQGINLDHYSLQLSLGENPADQIRHNYSCTGCDVWAEQSGVVKKIVVPPHDSIVERRIAYSPGDYYAAPPVGNRQLARFFVQHIGGDSLPIAQNILRKTEIVIEHPH